MNVQDMIKETQYSLESVGPDKVELYFIFKIANSQTKTWDLCLLRGRITEPVRQAFIEGAKEQFDNIPDTAQFEKYGELTGTDRPIIEYTSLHEVKKLSDVILNLRNPKATIPDFSQDKLNLVWGYLVHVASDPPLVLFNKYAFSKLAVRTIKVRVMEDKLDLTSEQTLVLSTECDVAVLLSEAEDFDNLPVCIFNEWKFETLFGYYAVYEKNVKKKEPVYGKMLLDDTETFVNECLKNPIKTKKMNYIVEHEEFIATKLNQIEKVNSSYKLGLEFKAGKIVTSRQNAWTILRLYGDDCLRSSCTNNKYLAYSKKRIK
jgi:hypothetical protein